MEIKDDSNKLAQDFTKSLERSSRDHGAAIGGLREQVVTFMDKSDERHQANFEVLVDLIKDLNSKP